MTFARLSFTLSFSCLSSTENRTSVFFQPTAIYRILSSSINACKRKLIIHHHFLNTTYFCDRFGSGATQGVIDGIDWTCKDHTEKRNKCVSNLSLGGGLSQAMNDAIDALFRCGCAVVCASGNNGRDACQGSPGSATDAYTVNAMDNTDKSASFTNYGECTQMYEPSIRLCTYIRW